MIELPRFVIALLTAFLLCAASYWASSVAQEVFDSPTPPEPTVTPESKAADKIRAALQDRQPPTPSGDPILDDVLQIIKQRGSILDGSSLDHGIDSSAEQASRSPTRDAAGPSVIKFRTAEQLLKAARMLEKIDPHDLARQELVEMLRRETVRLMSN